MGCHISRALWAFGGPRSFIMALLFSLLLYALFAEYYRESLWTAELQRPGVLNVPFSIFKKGEGAMCDG